MARDNRSKEKQPIGDVLRARRVEFSKRAFVKWPLF